MPEEEDWEKLKNDVEMIKTRVSSLDRISVLQNAELIIRDVRALVGSSEHRVILLHLTKTEHSRQQLAEKMGMDPRNLNYYINPFLGNKGYINEFRKGKEVYYCRDEKLDLIDFDGLEGYAEIIAKWEAQGAE